MKKTYIMSKRIACLLILLLIGIVTACGNGSRPGNEKAATDTTQDNTIPKSDKSPELLNCTLYHRDDSAGVYFKINVDDFNALGFSYGDSVDLEFSNGYKMEDVPYYNGYYVDAYQPVLVTYHGTGSLKATINYGDDLWAVAGVSDGDTGSVYLHEKQKYKAVQESMDIYYSDDRNEYSSDEEFANFRNVTAGKIKDGVLYRSASPCNNMHQRAPYADDLVEKAGILLILDLADNDKEIKGYFDAEDFDSPCFKKLYEKENVLPLDMSMNYLTEDFQSALAQGLTKLTEKEGPYLVNCTEGKDRTGFVCMLLEALCGATYEEIEKDYMTTYDNYYGINEQSDPEKYRTIKEQNLDAMINAIIEEENVDITTADLSVCAKDYMLRIGMSQQTVDKLEELLCR